MNRRPFFHLLLYLIYLIFILSSLLSLQSCFDFSKWSASKPTQQANSSGTTNNSSSSSSKQTTITSNSESYNFGSYPMESTSPAFRFVISNRGPISATNCKEPYLSGVDSSNFAIASTTCTTGTMIIHSTCSISVYAKPQELTGSLSYLDDGKRTAVLTRECDETGSTVNINLSVSVSTMTDFNINNEISYTTSRNVTLYLNATNGPSEYCATENDSYAGCIWQTYSSATANFTLSSSGDGIKTVNVWLATSITTQGFVSRYIGKVYSDQILLDTTGPIPTISWANADNGGDAEPVGAGSTDNSTLTFRVSFDEDVTESILNAGMFTISSGSISNINKIIGLNNTWSFDVSISGIYVSKIVSITFLANNVHDVYGSPGNPNSASTTYSFNYDAPLDVMSVVPTTATGQGTVVATTLGSRKFKATINFYETVDHLAADHIEILDAASGNPYSVFYSTDVTIDNFIPLGTTSSATYTFDVELGGSDVTSDIKFKIYKDGNPAATTIRANSGGHDMQNDFTSPSYSFDFETTTGSVTFKDKDGNTLIAGTNPANNQNCEEVASTRKYKIPFIFTFSRDVTDDLTISDVNIHITGAEEDAAIAVVDTTPDNLTRISSTVYSGYVVPQTIRHGNLVITVDKDNVHDELGSSLYQDVSNDTATTKMHFNFIAPTVNNFYFTNPLTVNLPIDAQTGVAFTDVSADFPVKMYIQLNPGSSDFTSNDLSIAFTDATGDISFIADTSTDYRFLLVHDVTSDREGIIDVSIDALTFTNSDGSKNLDATSTKSRRFDFKKPEVTLSILVNGTYDICTLPMTSTITPIPVAITFDKPVSNFDVSNDAQFTFTNGSIEDFAPLALPIIGYSANIYPLSNTGTSIYFVVKAGAVYDKSAGNFTDVSTDCTVSMNDTAASPPHLDSFAMKIDSGGDYTYPSGTYTSKTTLGMQLIFSEYITGLDASDIVISGEVTSDVQINSLTRTAYNTFTFDVTPPTDTSSDGIITLTLGPNKYYDTWGNLNTDTNSFTINYDQTAPNITSFTAGAATIGSDAYTNINPFIVDVTSDDLVTGLAADDFVFSNCSIGAITPSSGYSNHFSVITSFDTTSDVCTLQLKSNAFTNYVGLSNTSASNTLTVHYDNIVPTGDPTTAALSTIYTRRHSATQFSVTATFSEYVLLDASDFTISNGTINSVTGTGANDGAYFKTFTILVTTAAAPLTLSMYINAATVIDRGGNSVNAQSNTISVVIDDTAPTALFSGQSTASANTGYSFSVTLTFDEDVVSSELQADDFSVDTGTLVGPTITAISGSIYTISGSVTAPVGLNFTLTLRIGAVPDLAENLNTLAATRTFTIDNTSPNVFLSIDAGNPLHSHIGGTNMANHIICPATIDVTSDEMIYNLDVTNDVVVTNATVVDGSLSPNSSSGNSFTLQINPASGDEITSNITVQIPAGRVNDDASNDANASNILTFQCNHPPTLTLKKESENPWINLDYPLTAANLNPPVIAGTPIVVKLTVGDQDTSNVGCYVESVNLNVSDANYYAPDASTDCSTLNSINTISGEVPSSTIDILGKTYFSTYNISNISDTKNSTWTWTPTNTQRGDFKFIFYAADTAGHTTISNAYISVRDNYPTPNANLLFMRDASVYQDDPWSSFIGDTYTSNLISPVGWTGTGAHGVPYALSFDATSYVDITTSDLSPNIGDFSASVWVNFGATAVTNKCIMGNKTDDGYNHGWSMCINPTDKFEVSITDDVSNDKKYSDSSNVNTNKWYNLSFSLGDTNSSFNLYRNGQLIINPNKSLDDVLTDPINPSTNLRIGLTLEGSQHLNEGQVALLQIFNTELTSSNVNNIFTSTANRFRSSKSIINNIETSGLVYYFNAPNAEEGMRFPNPATTCNSIFNLSINQITSNLENFAACGVTDGWLGTETSDDSYRLSFDGSNDDVSIDTNEFLNAMGESTTSDFTIAAWVRPTSLASMLIPYTIFSSYSAPPKGIDFHIDTNKNFYLIYRTLTNIWEDDFIASTTIASDNNWYYVVVVRDTSAINGKQIKIYVNGILEDEKVESTSTNISYGDYTTTYIGARVGNFFFKGDIASLSIYNTALSSDKISQNFFVDANRFRLHPVATFNQNGLVLHLDPSNSQDRLRYGYTSTAPTNTISDLSVYNNNFTSSSGDKVRGSINLSAATLGGSGSTSNPYKITLNTSNSYIEIPGNEALDDTSITEGTYVFWFKVNASSGVNCNIISHHDSSSIQNGIQLILDGDQKYAARGWNDTGVNVFNITSSDASSDSWKQVALTYKQTSSNINKIYINGNEKGSATNSAAWDFTPNENTYIGKNIIDACTGDLGITKIYNRNLRPEELIQMYNAEKSTYGY